MKKRCTNPACRRVFSTVGGYADCPHCGKTYRLNKSAAKLASHVQDWKYARGAGGTAYVMRGKMQHLWLGPLRKDGKLDRSRCGCVLTLKQVSDDNLKLRRLKVIRGEDRFLSLLDAKHVIEAMMAHSTVLHTDAVTAREVVKSGYFPVLHVRRNGERKPTPLPERKCPNVACGRMFRPGEGRVVCPSCGLTICRTVLEDTLLPERPHRGGTVQMERIDSVTHVWLGDKSTDRMTEIDKHSCRCRVQLGKLSEVRFQAAEPSLYRVLAGADGYLDNRYHLDRLMWCMLRGPLVLHTDLATARAMVRSGLFPLQRVTCR